LYIIANESIKTAQFIETLYKGHTMVRNKTYKAEITFSPLQNSTLTITMSELDCVHVW